MTKYFIPILLLSFTLILFLNSAAAANAAVAVPVNNTIYVNGTGGNDSNNGTSWDSAKATIQNGTDTVDDDGTVYVADGIYKEHINKDENHT